MQGELSQAKMKANCQQELTECLVLDGVIGELESGRLDGSFDRTNYVLHLCDYVGAVCVGNAARYPEVRACNKQSAQRQ